MSLDSLLMRKNTVIYLDALKVIYDKHEKRKLKFIYDSTRLLLE